MKERNLTAQPPEGLGQFASSGTAADDGQAPGFLRKGEDRFVREKTGLRYSINSRVDGPRARCNDSPLKF